MDLFLTTDVVAPATVSDWRACRVVPTASEALRQAVASKGDLFVSWSKTGVFREDEKDARDLESLRVIDAAVLLENQKLLGEQWTVHPVFARIASPAIIIASRESQLRSIAATWALLSPRSPTCFWQDSRGVLFEDGPEVEAVVSPIDFVWEYRLPDDLRSTDPVIHTEALYARRLAVAVKRHKTSAALALIREIADTKLTGDPAHVIPLALQAIRSKVGEPNWVSGNPKTVKRVGLNHLLQVQSDLPPEELILGYRGPHWFDAGVQVQTYLQFIPGHPLDGFNLAFPIYSRYAIAVRPKNGPQYFAHLKLT